MSILSNILPEIGSLLVGAAASGIGTHLQRKRERERDIPMATKTISEPYNGFCSVAGCNELAVEIDHQNYVVCAGHAQVQRQQLAQMQQAQMVQRPPQLQSQPQVRPAPSARQRQQLIDPHDAATVRDRRQAVRSRRQEPMTRRDYRDDFYEDDYDDEDDYLDEDEYDDGEGLCIHGNDPSQCRGCYELLMKKAAQSRVELTPRSPQRPVSPRSQRSAPQDNRRVNRGAKQFPQRRQY